MPRGVTDQFLKILRHERRTSLRTILAMAGLAIVAYFMAELTDDPLAGRVVILGIVVLLLSLAGGLGLGILRTRAYNDSIRDSWNAWMRMSLSCNRVDEVARHVKDKSRAPPLSGVGWMSLFAANVLLFIFLWLETSYAMWFGIVVTIANFVTLGVLAGLSIWILQWARRFQKSLDELLAQGQLGLWGEV